MVAEDVVADEAVTRTKIVAAIRTKGLLPVLTRNPQQLALMRIPMPNVGLPLFFGC